MKFLPLLYTLFFLLLTVILSIAVGAVFIPVADVWRVLPGQPPQVVTQAATIILALRLPRTALVLLTGAALGGSGAAYQGLFRNPLADPYLIGVASGAGLGAVLAILVWGPLAYGAVRVNPDSAEVPHLYGLLVIQGLTALAVVLAAVLWQAGRRV